MSEDQSWRIENNPYPAPENKIKVSWYEYMLSIFLLVGIGYIGINLISKISKKLK